MPNCVKIASCLIDISEEAEGEIYTIWAWDKKGPCEDDVMDVIKRMAALCQIKGFNVYKLFQDSIDDVEKCKVRTRLSGELFDMDFSGYAFEYMDECVPQADQPEGRSTQTEICFP